MFADCSKVSTPTFGCSNKVTKFELQAAELKFHTAKNRLGRAWFAHHRQHHK